MSSFTDNNLMLRVAEGEVTNLGILFERYRRKLYNYFLRQVRKPEQAEDLIQEVFFRIWKYRHTYTDKMPFQMWIFRIAHNVGADHFGKQKGDMQLEEGDEGGQVFTDPMDGLAKGKDLGDLRSALAELSPDKREVLILSRFHDMKYSEIARVTGTSVGAVKVRVHRALNDLRDRFFRIGKERVS